MIRIQIVEQEGASLYRTLVKAMRRGDLRTFTVKNRGRKVAHINYPGWLRWGTLHGVIAGEVGSKRPGEEWQLLHALLARLSDRFSASIRSISIQFEADGVPDRTRRRRAHR